VIDPYVIPGISIERGRALSVRMRSGNGPGQVPPCAIATVQARAGNGSGAKAVQQCDSAADEGAARQCGPGRTGR
jgi:hypothetical protein